MVDSIRRLEKRRVSKRKKLKTTIFPSLLSTRSRKSLGRDKGFPLEGRKEERGKKERKRRTV